MKIVVASDKWKGSLSAPEACAAMARGLRTIWPAAEILERPIADGGEGTAESCIAPAVANGLLAVRGPLGDPVEAHYALLADGTAVIEMAAAAGLALLKPEQVDPWRATTFGVGQLMRDAADRGARRIIVGLGGSATNDGGVGMASALGWEFGAPPPHKGGQCFQSEHEKLMRRPGESGTAWKDCPPKAAVLVDRSDRLPFPWTIDYHDAAAITPPASGFGGLPFAGTEEMIEVLAACDVTNPLLGSRGATRIFGPQKGVKPDEIEVFESALRALAACFPPALADTPGAGAAGGLGFGLLAFCRARIGSGFGMVAALIKLDESVAAADLVVTGEGCLDAQTLDGKGPHGVAQLAHTRSRPVVGIGGRVLDEARPAFDLTIAVTPPEMPLDEAIRQAPELIEQAVCREAPHLLTLVKK